jgi:hypothetical protein
MGLAGRWRVLRWVMGLMVFFRRGRLGFWRRSEWGEVAIAMVFTGSDSRSQRPRVREREREFCRA